MHRKEEALKAIGDRIRFLRKNKGLNQTELANVMGKDQPDLARIESGKVNVGVVTLLEIAEALEVDPCEIIRFEEE